jgi:tRNA G18 (ribose-2'-O)-methylase SpoU
MSDRWNLWTRNVIDRYKSWSTESIKRDLQRTANPFAVCMEHWQGDFNISTLIRNANAFNAKKVYYLGKKRFDRRGTVGTHHYVDLSYLGVSRDLLVDLKKDYTIVAIDNNIPNTRKLDEFDWSSLEKPPLMVFGEEGMGLTEGTLNIADCAVEIPQYGSVRSLNVGTSSGIVMYDFISKQRNSINPENEQKLLHDGINDEQLKQHQLPLLLS